MEVKLYENFEIDIDKCWKILENHKYYNLYKEGYDEGYHQPPLTFKKFTGIDICGKYNFGRLDIKNIQLLLAADESKENMIKLWNYLIPLNPCLKKININSSDQLWDVLYGMVSLINLEDIQSFIDGKVGFMVHETEYYQNLREKLEKFDSKISQFHLQWVISEPTPNRIIKEISRFKFRIKRLKRKIIELNSKII